MLATALALVLSAGAQDGDASPGPGEVGPAQVLVAPPRGTHFRGALESLVLSFPSGTPGGAQDLFVTATPLLGFDGGDDFGFELGADLRLRIFDDPPAQKDSDIGHLIRREDWDESSDFGQLLRELRIGPEDGALAIRAGPQLGYTLGHGHLVARYSNRDNPDYHPAGANAHLVIGPTRSELLASDVLASRVFAAETSVDMGRVFGTDPNQFDRYHLAVSFAHDSGATGVRAPQLTMLHIDFDLALHRSPEARVFAYTGLGSRIFVPVADLGALLGVSAEGSPGGMEVGGRIEARKQAGGFRHGMFGPAYELSRHSAVGLDGGPLANQALPDAYSGYAELALASGTAGGSSARVVFSAAVEYFSWGRFDADSSLALILLEGKALATARGVAIGIGGQPRYLATVEVRYRFASALYAVGSFGTVFFPQPDSSLVRGLTGGAGVGVDFER